MGRPALSETHETVKMTIYVPADRYNRLIRQAKRRGWTHGNGPAQAKITLAAIDAGLPLLEQEKVTKAKATKKRKARKKAS